MSDFIVSMYSTNRKQWEVPMTQSALSCQAQIGWKTFCKNKFPLLIACMFSEIVVRIVYFERSVHSIWNIWGVVWQRSNAKEDYKMYMGKNVVYSSNVKIADNNQIWSRACHRLLYI
jgi:hypothetical protein